MHLPSFLTTLVLGFAATASARPSSTCVASKKCTNPTVRKSWGSLATSDKTAYINAVKCMINTPPKLNEYAAGVTNRWEDFIWTHQRVMPTIHGVGHFLPWHRLFLFEYERVLRVECGYEGTIPYWDQKADNADIFASPVFDTEFGFGGNGAFDPTALIPFINITADGGGCIQDGPFKDLTIHLGYNNDSSYQERCITRNIIQAPASRWWNAQEENNALAHPTYEIFAELLEGNGNFTFDLGMHNAGHMAVAGDMLDTWVSPGDPVFYLLHGNIDRIWAKWQQSASAKLFAVGNPIRPRLPISDGLLATIPEGNVTLDYVIDLGPLAGDRLKIPVARVMDPMGTVPKGYKKGLLCYDYE